MTVEQFWQIFWIQYYQRFNRFERMNPKISTYQRFGNFIINKSEPLGSGNFGHVWKGYLITPKNNLQPVAIKQSYNQTQNIKQIQALQILNHPNIIRYRDYRISGNTVFMVMELCEGGTLDDLLYRLCMQGYSNHTYVDKIIQYYSQIIKGIKFMYEKKIIHRDIKPSNILVNKYNIIKIADFGTSKMGGSSEAKLKTLVGTPLFFSPELFEMSFGQQDTYTQKSQIWALGLILYFMFNYQYTIVRPAQRMKQSLPWTGRNTAQIFKNIKNQPLQFKKQSQIPTDIKSIISKMLKINAEERMSFEQLFSLQIFKQKQQLLMTSPIMQPLTEQDQLHQENERTININQTKRQTIDWQLQQLLERKDQQLSEDESKQQLRQFYQLLLKQLLDYQMGCPNALNDEKNSKYTQELMFELQFMYYQITDNVDEKNRILTKYTHKTDKYNRFKQLDKKFSSTPIGIEQFQENPSLFNNNITNLTSTSRLHLDFLFPNENLLQASKIFLNNHKQIIHPLRAKTEGSKIKWKNEKDGLTENQKIVINIVYDLFTLITFQKSWQMKRKSKATIGQFKKTRKFIKSQTILLRVLKAYECINI